MADFHRITDDVWVAPQLSVHDVARAADLGVGMIVANRPDGEAPDQPASAEIETAARTAGLAFVAVPISGRPDAAQAQAVGEAIAAHPGPALLYCKSGMRSAAAWAMAAVAAGGIDAATARELARGAGYDLSGLPL